MSKQKKVINLSKFTGGAEFELDPLEDEKLQLWAQGVVAPSTLTDEQKEESSELAKKPINVADTTALINFITQTAIANISDDIQRSLVRVELLQYIIDKELDISKEQLEEYKQEFREKMKEEIALLEEQVKEQQEEEEEKEEGEE